MMDSEAAKEQVNRGPLVDTFTIVDERNNRATVRACSKTEARTIARRDFAWLHGKLTATKLELDERKPRPMVADPKIKPNDPCVCGSGKKYKKCCRRSREKPSPLPLGKTQ